MAEAPELIVHNAKITTLNPAQPQASALAIRGGRFLAVGDQRDVMSLAGSATRIIDVDGRRVVPGLIDNHIHMIRGGLTFNTELRWDGVRSLATAMSMLKQQVARTPPPQWVRVVGGYSELQFSERRLPTLDELNAAAPDTPVMLTHLYDRLMLNRAAVVACGYSRSTPDSPGAHIERRPDGEPTGLIVANPDPAIIYATLARAPKLPPEYQVNSTRQFMRELNCGFRGHVARDSDKSSPSIPG